MPRLIDDIRAPGAKIAMPWFIAPQLQERWNELGARVWTCLHDPQLPVLLIDNVADYYYSSDQEYWDLRDDFPNLAPPYPMFWLECKMPRRIHSKEKGDTDVTAFMPNGRQGALCIVANPDHVRKAMPIPDGTRWILHCEQFHDYGFRSVTATGPIGSIVLFIDADGHLLQQPAMVIYCADDYKNEMHNFITYLHPALLAISFLHCKNVAVVDGPVPPKLAKKYERNHGVKPVVPKTLVIEPLKQILRREGRSHDPGGSIQKSLHICRGHFRDYREGRGLFGKLHGVFWSPQTVRGPRGNTPAPREIRIKIGVSATKPLNGH
jgi:hypothetical protein